MKRVLCCALLLAFVLPARLLADQEPTYHGPVSSAENAFVGSMTADLMQRYPTASDAEKAGFMRYTAEDETGAISYVNVHQWQSGDVHHPSQL